MKMTKVAIITDLHLGYKENTSQAKMMYKYLNNFIHELSEKNIHHLFILGDIFDNRETINFLTLKNTYNIFNLLLEKNIQTYIIAGNHDCYYKNTNDVYSVELLFNHIKNLHIIKNIGKKIIIDNTSFLLIPWINSNNYEQNINLIKESNDDYLMGHFEINGFTMVKGIRCKNGLSQEIFKKFKKVFSGHFHLREIKNNIYYIGTPYEKDWSDLGTDKGYAILNTENNEITFVNNKEPHFITLEYNNGIDLKNLNLENKEIKLILNVVDKQTDLENTLQNISALNPNNLTIIDNTNIITNQDTSDSEEISYENNDNLEIFKKYVNNLNLNEHIDKNKINEMLINLYNESISK